MTNPISDQTRLQIRQSIGYNVGTIIVSAVTDTKDTSSLWDTYALAKGSTNEYNGRQVQINVPSGSIAAGEKSFVSAFNSTDKDATMSPLFTQALTDGDTYEMWKLFTIEEVNNMIAQAEIEATDDALTDKEDHATATESKRYQYGKPTGFVAVHKVEYVSTVGVEKLIHDCEKVWDELVDGDVTATLDTAFKKVGSGSLKLVVAAGAAAADILATDDITELDLSGATEIEIWVYSTVALDAGDIELLLDDTAQCASPVERLEIPATSASVWAKHIISLANPENDSAIISVGLEMDTDKGAFTLRVDDIKAADANTRIWEELNPQLWSLVRGSTDYLKLTSQGLGVVGANKLLRLSGYQKFTAMTSDSSTSEVDPDFIIARVTGRMLGAHVKSPQLDVSERLKMADRWNATAEERKIQMRTDYLSGTHWF